MIGAILLGVSLHSIMATSALSTYHQQKHFYSPPPFNRIGFLQQNQQAPLSFQNNQQNRRAIGIRRQNVSPHTLPPQQTNPLSNTIYPSSFSLVIPTTSFTSGPLAYPGPLQREKNVSVYPTTSYQGNTAPSGLSSHFISSSNNNSLHDNTTGQQGQTIPLFLEKEDTPPLPSDQHNTSFLAPSLKALGSHESLKNTQERSSQETPCLTSTSPPDQSSTIYLRATPSPTTSLQEQQTRKHSLPSDTNSTEDPFAHLSSPSLTINEINFSGYFFNEFSSPNSSNNAPKTKEDKLQELDEEIDKLNKEIKKLSDLRDAKIQQRKTLSPEDSKTIPSNNQQKPFSLRKVFGQVPYTSPSTQDNVGKHPRKPPIPQRRVTFDQKETRRMNPFFERISQNKVKLKKKRRPRRKCSSRTSPQSHINVIPPEKRTPPYQEVNNKDGNEKPFSLPRSSSSKKASHKPNKNVSHSSPTANQPIIKVWTLKKQQKSPPSFPKKQPPPTSSKKKKRKLKKSSPHTVKNQLTQSKEKQATICLNLKLEDKSDVSPPKKKLQEKKNKRPSSQQSTPSSTKPKNALTQSFKKKAVHKKKSTSQNKKTDKKKSHANHPKKKKGPLNPSLQKKQKGIKHKKKPHYPKQFKASTHFPSIHFSLPTSTMSLSSLQKIFDQPLCYGSARDLLIELFYSSSNLCSHLLNEYKQKNTLSSVSLQAGMLMSVLSVPKGKTLRPVIEEWENNILRPFAGRVSTLLPKKEQEKAWHLCASLGKFNIHITSDLETSLSLFIAVSNGLIHKLKAHFILHPKDAFARNKHGDTLLHMAGLHDHLDLAILLVETYKVDIDARSQSGTSPLSYCLPLSKVYTYLCLRKKEKKKHKIIDKITQKGLFKIIQEKNKEKLETYIKDYGLTKACLNSLFDENGLPILHYCIHHKAYDLLGYFLQVQHLSLYVRDKKDESTALLFAAQYLEKKSIEILIAHGADIGARNRKGQTMAHFFISKGTIEDIKWGVEVLEIDLGSTCCKGFNVMHYAVLNKRKKIIPYLITQKVDPDEMDAQGEYNAILLALKRKYFDIAYFLLDQIGVNIYILNDRAKYHIGQFCIVEKADQDPGYVSFVKHLLKNYHFDPLEKTMSGRNSIEEACFRKHIELEVVFMNWLKQKAIAAIKQEKKIE